MEAQLDPTINPRLFRRTEAGYVDKIFWSCRLLSGCNCTSTVGVIDFTFPNGGNENGGWVWNVVSEAHPNINARGGHQDGLICRGQPDKAICQHATLMRCRLCYGFCAQRCVRPPEPSMLGYDERPFPISNGPSFFHTHTLSLSLSLSSEGGEQRLWACDSRVWVRVSRVRAAIS